MRKIEFSQMFETTCLSVDPTPVSLSAGEAELATIAERLKLHGLTGLGANVDLSLDGESGSPGTGVALSGRLTATGEQICVVTLEPVPFALDTAFAGVFLTSTADEHQRDEFTLSEDEIDVLGTISDDLIDLGEAIIQQLALELDPFPRREGAEVETTGDDDNESTNTASGPFAALAALKDSLK